MLKARLLTAALLLFLVLAAIFLLPALPFALLLAAIMAYAMWEWTLLAGVKSMLWRLFSTAVFAVVAAMLYLHISWFSKPSLLVFLFMVLLIWCWAAMAVYAYNKGRSSIFLANTKWLCLLLGEIIILAAGLVILLLRQADQGIFFLLFAFSIVWGSDSVAYFVGRAYGKHLFAPLVSPKKTWEGVAGAWLGSAVVAIVAWLLQLTVLHAAFSSSVHLHLVASWQASAWLLLKYLVLALVTSCFCLLGDLFESMLKRQQGLKDSGHFLPGHGGLLDRIDAMLAALPVFFLLYSYLLVGSF